MKQRNIAALQAFQAWFLSPSGPNLLHIPLYYPTNKKEGAMAITLYRRNGYQAELCLIPQGYDCRLSLPEGMPVILTFLGGSLDCDISTLSHFPQMANSDSLPDGFLIQMGENPYKPRLEQPHPLLLQTADRYTLPLSKGEESNSSFSTPRGDGVLLFFSFYQEDTDTALSIFERLHFSRGETSSNP
ncbi:hypothetical protein NQF87_07250 [Bombella sp. TMW 2.2559]|uniref:Uncharacterized protein n=1 Tax=Bombella dulcis TaxID=2967339 RepID=A0ABT3WIU7_9PROT|nr:hypothetical protein [Bombella dulcis]MCX5616766.1 hypothetical protein [Bombella dulcis]